LIGFQWEFNEKPSVVGGQTSLVDLHFLKKLNNPQLTSEDAWIEGIVGDETYALAANATLRLKWILVASPPPQFKRNYQWNWHSTRLFIGSRGVCLEHGT